jgi:peptidoglycan biosynthesis protein MviN/MurJ (putative lipid II flippase)
MSTQDVRTGEALVLSARRKLPRLLRPAALLGDTSRLLRRPTGRALIGTLVGNIPGFLLPFAITARMHVGHLTDAYAFALGVALFASWFFVIVLQTNALPVFQRMKPLGREAYIGRVRRLALESSCVATLLYAVIGAASVVYIDHGSHWTLEQQEFLLIATAVFTAFVVASAINGVLSAGLNALNSFLTPAASQAMKSLAPLAAIAFISRDTNGLIIIAVLIAGGEIARTVVLARELRRAASSLSSDPAPPGYAGLLPMWRVAAPVALSSLISGGSLMIDRGVAAQLPAGSVTYVDLGEKVFQIPQQIIVASLVLVAGTLWADIRTTDVPRLSRHVLRTLTRGGLVCVALLAAMAAVLGIVSLIAGRTLAGGSTVTLLSVIALLLAGLPGAFVIACGSRFLTSTRTTYLLPGLGVFYFATNLGFDLVGAHWFGVEGIALSSTLSRCLSALLYIIIMKRLIATHFHGLGFSWRRQALREPATPTET